MKPSDKRAMPGELMTLPEVAAYLKIAERTVYDWIKKDKLPAFKIGTAWRFERADMTKWVQEQKRK